MRRIAATFILWLWFCALPFAEAPVYIRVHPQAATVGQTLSVLIRVEPHEANRELCFKWGIIEEDMYSSSCVQLDGLAARRSYQWRRTLYTSGDWAFIATVRRSDGSGPQARVTVIVVGGF